MTKILFFLLAIFSIAQSYELDRITPREVEKNIAKNDIEHIKKNSSKSNDEVLIESLKGILLGAEISVLENSSICSGIEIFDLKLPGSQKKFKAKLAKYLGKQVTQETLRSIKRETINYYKSYNRPLIHVQIPRQNITSGIVKIIIHESRLGKITSKGNCYFKDKNILCPMRLESGKIIDTGILIDDLDWINRNPFRQTDAVFIPATEPGFTDIELISNDRTPFRAYAGVDNTGLEASGHNRWYLGFNWANVFGLDHELSYQFTTGSYYDAFWAHSLHYTAPIQKLRHILTLYGGYSQASALMSNFFEEGMPLPMAVKTDGYSAQASMRYEIPIRSFKDVLQEIVLGFDFKRTNTNISLDGDLLRAPDSVNLTQVVLGYNAGFETNRIKTFLTAELFWSPGKWLDDQSDNDYQQVRAFAKNNYVYGRFSFNPIFKLPGCFLLDYSLKGQISSQNLLASEQFGLGGFYTVRGYQERQLNTDNAFLFTTELKTPPFSILKPFRRASCIKDCLVFLLFYDLGFGANYKIIEGEKSSHTLMSIGPGVRYTMGCNLSMRGDWGFQLKRFEDNPRNYMFHFGLVFSF